VKIEPRKKYYVEIETVSGDGECNQVVHKMSGKELLSLMPLIDKIKAFTAANPNEYNWEAGYNYSDGEIPMKIYGLTEEEFYCLDDYIPCEEYGCHTIEYIKVYPCVKKWNLL
tara:strand:- start:556 stop:894 length:339 start_codon:yes stop_codon:yes gene_type:complete